MIEVLPEWAAMLTNQSCPIGKHPDWFINSEHNHRCPWCEIDRLRLELERTSEPAGDHPMTEIGERVDGRIRDLAELCTRHGTPCADGLLAEIGRLRTENARLKRRDEEGVALSDLDTVTHARTEAMSAARHALIALRQTLAPDRNPAKTSHGISVTTGCVTYDLGKMGDAIRAHLIDDVPALIDEVRRLRAEVVEAEQATAEFGSLVAELARTEGDLGVAIREAAAAREALQAMRPLLAHVNDSVPTIGIPAALRLIDAALDQRLAQ